MTPISNHKIWLKAVCDYFDVTEDEIITSRKHGYVGEARSIFYWLCFKDKIDLYRLSETLGKERTSILSSVKKNPSLDKESINKIWNNVKARNTEERICTSN